MGRSRKLIERWVQAKLLMRHGPHAYTPRIVNTVALLEDELLEYITGSRDWATVARKLVGEGFTPSFPADLAVVRRAGTVPIAEIAARVPDLRANLRDDSPQPGRKHRRARGNAGEPRAGEDKPIRRARLRQ